MSDRVEERMEAQRLEARRLQDKMAEVKRTQNNGEFKRMVSNAQQTRGQASKQDANKQQKQNRGNTMLMVRAGIKSNDQAQRVYHDTDARMLKSRDNEHLKEGELSARSTAQLKDNAKSTLPPVSSKNNQGDGKSKGKDDTKREATENRREQVLAGAGAQGGLQPLVGVSPKQGSSGAGATSKISQAQIEQIVKAMRKGVDAKGLGMIDIELKDDVLGGARLQLNSTKAGINLTIFADAHHGDLLASGESARELAQAMKQQGLNLNTLEVNGKKVIR